MKKKFILGFLIFIILTSSAVFVSAQSDTISITKNDDINIEKDQSYSYDLFGFYNAINIDGELTANLTAISSKGATINGKIYGLTIIGTNSVHLDGGDFNRDVVLIDALSTITNSVIADDMIAVSLYSFESDDSTIFEDDVYIYSSGSVTIRGQIKGNLYIKADNVTLDAKINKNATIYSDNIGVSANSIISGNLNYYSTLNASIDNQAHITGDINHHNIAADGSSLQNKINFLAIGISFFKILLLVFLTWIFLLLCPNFVDNTVITLKRNPFISLLVGIGVLFSTVVLSIFMILSGFLLAPGIFLFGVYSFLILISIIPFISIIKSKLTNFKLYKFDILIIICILFAVNYIPVLGPVFILLLYGFGSGCIYITFINIIKQKIKLRKQ
jgi:hypothetical protein